MLLKLQLGIYICNIDLVIIVSEPMYKIVNMINSER